jgi:hypothetical protein
MQRSAIYFANYTTEWESYYSNDQNYTHERSKKNIERVFFLFTHRKKQRSHKRPLISNSF